MSKRYYEAPCRYKHTCGFEYCNLSDCEHYEAKTPKNKWAEDEQQDEDCEDDTEADTSHD